MILDPVDIELRGEERAVILGPELGRAVGGQTTERDGKRSRIPADGTEHRAGHREFLDARVVHGIDTALDVVEQGVAGSLVHGADQRAVGCEGEFDGVVEAASADPLDPSAVAQGSQRGQRSLRAQGPRES